jgi:uncharacterized protein YkwD
MRFTRATITTLLATAALAVSAQAAFADVPATVTTTDYGTGAVSTCTTGYQAGVTGAYGAWGDYVDGCTVRLTCTDSVPCRVSNRSVIITEGFAGHRVTMNARIRFINSSGAVYGWRDKSCAGTNWCRVDDESYISPGQSASVQCNGVRQTGANRARVRCQINVTRSCNNADVPVNRLSQVDAEAAVLCLTNAQRSANGLAALAPNAALGSAARGHAQAAVSIKWWNGGDPHVNPQTGSTPGSRIAAAGYCPAPKYHRNAENAYWGYATGAGAAAPTPRAAVTWWMNSAGHRANILDPDLMELGVGVVLGTAAPVAADQAGTFVQNFGTCIN